MLETHPRFPHLPLTNVKSRTFKKHGMYSARCVGTRKEEGQIGMSVGTSPCPRSTLPLSLQPVRHEQRHIDPPLSQQVAMPSVPRNSKNPLDADDEIMGRPSSGFPPSGRAPSSAGPGSLRVAGTHSVPRLDYELTEATLSKP